jgi:hypothetical protein
MLCSFAFLEFDSTIGAVAAFRIDLHAAVRTESRSASGYSENQVRINVSRRIALNPFAFLSTDFIYCAAVWAGDKISLSKAEQRKKEKGKLFINTGDEGSAPLNGTAGEKAAVSQTEFCCAAGNPYDEKHFTTSESIILHGRAVPVKWYT